MDKTNETGIRLTKRDINKSFILWWLICEISNSYERMQSVAFCASLSPILRKLYRTKEELSQALTRHLNFFNSQGTWGSLIHGITIAMEEQKANNGKIPENAITGIKTGLMGPFAGIGDTIDWGTLKPIIFALACSFGATGSVFGAFIPFLFTIVTVIEGYYLWNFGYSVGKESVKSILQSGWVKELITGASILGLFMMGALAASFVKLDIPLTINIEGGEPLKVQALLDSIAPGILPLLVTFSIYWYLKKRGQNFTIILLSILILSLAGSYIGLF
ncbi:PTS system mannose/fructose/sorbose family transporter subunit IID [Oceanobacillus alkalisoli]|uniref:PTS system mannose/fructose/sorbose family transporter subunit IID n=1 Tax=Oceanobacillus alkalisoli TaxID=2925113 RepID=UPI001EF08AC3|nr:PTS system mannose/fructose/sorbose family transporter subunit IID [Oceanobacillus alkalisoli]MCF3944096.1 PTS system mannose/fructose/sorbose family transporter subunit IID [Oceanobacillus alkalisoli]MCG5102503.1 PTS system mannose/fructose/sorbose family transporter subunit IID [Oceanobacillus alkalisoli]